MKRFQKRPANPSKTLKLYNNRTKGMRYLYFSNDEVAATNYDFLYEVLIGKQGGYAQGQIRLVNKILTKLESFGKLRGGNPQADAEGKAGLYSLSQPNTWLAFEEAEYELAKSAISGITFPGMSVKKGVVFLDWFESAINEDAYKKLTEDNTSASIGNQ